MTVTELCFRDKFGDKFNGNHDNFGVNSMFNSALGTMYDLA